MTGLAVMLGAVVAALAWALWRGLNPPLTLEISERGILDRRLALGWLDWDSIEGAYRPRISSGDRVLLRVRLDDRIRSRLGRRFRLKGPRPESLELSLDLTGTRYSEVEVLHEIIAHSQNAAHDLPATLDHLACR